MTLPTVVAKVALATNPTEAPTWIDISAYVRGFSTRRGRSSEFERIQAGSGMLLLDNRDRRFDPTYTAGPYYGTLLPMRRVWLSTSSPGRGYDILTGFATGWPQHWRGPNDAFVPVPIVDGFAVLARKKLNASYPQERTDQRIGRVLDDAGWTTGNVWVLDSASNSQLGTTTILGPNGGRLLGQGDSSVQAVTLAGTIALEHCLSVAESENGLFFISRDGSAYFLGRHASGIVQALLVTNSTFGDGATAGEHTYLDLQLDYDDRMLWNEVRVTRTGGAVQTANDATSQAKYFNRTLERSPLIPTDGEALDMANWLLTRYKDPGMRVVGMDLRPERESATQWPVVLGLELGDRITVKRTPPGGGNVISQQSIVEGIEHQVRARDWTVHLNLSPADTVVYWQLDSTIASQLGTTTRLAYAFLPFGLFADALPFTATGAAIALTMLADPGVRRIIGMALRAMGLQRVRPRWAMCPLFRPTLLILQTKAFAACTATLLRMTGVRRIIGMALRAMGLQRIASGGSVPSQLIYDRWDCLKMRGVDTASIAAKMVNLKAIGDRSIPQSEGDPMGVQRALTIPCLGVATRGMRAVPQPALRAFKDAAEERC